MNNPEITPDTHYFAYGTLLGQAAMCGYTPGAECVGTAQLAHHRLVFERYSDERPEYGGCSLEHVPGEVVNGTLYRVPADEYASLDLAVRLEQKWFAKIPVLVTMPDGAVVEASTYVIPHSLGRFAPSDHYVRDIVPGALERCFPQWYVDRLQAAVDEHQALAGGGR